MAKDALVIDIDVNSWKVLLNKLGDSTECAGFASAGKDRLRYQNDLAN